MNSWRTFFYPLGNFRLFQLYLIRWLFAPAFSKSRILLLKQLMWLVLSVFIDQQKWQLENQFSEGTKLIGCGFLAFSPPEGHFIFSTCWFSCLIMLCHEEIFGGVGVEFWGTSKYLLSNIFFGYSIVSVFPDKYKNAIFLISLSWIWF